MKQTAGPAGHVAIGIPVRDEVQRLPRLLDALSRQSEAGGFIACFLLDGCRDESEVLLRSQAETLPFRVKIASLPRCRPNAGRARRAAMQLCLEALGHAPGSIVLTTDADSIPLPGWVEANCASLASVDVVAGYIERKTRHPDSWRTQLEDYLARLHDLRRALDPIEYDPLPSHPCLGAASLGFRTDAYRDLGGFPEYPHGEDTAIVAKARREGYRVRHDHSVQVMTSGRTEGRAPGGLADELKAQISQIQPPLVPNPVVLSRHYEKQALARRAFNCGETRRTLSRQFDLCPDYLEDVCGLVRGSDAFVAHVAPDNAIDRVEVLPLPEAERQLALLRVKAPERAVA
ncbi:MAG: glycosyltransferase [Henriciella sp.]|uniref:glycosyltransferase n=1 Tax=Henriciella sp. TaxID=1968823 RepID=UPI003C727B43